MPKNDKENKKYVKFTNGHFWDTFYEWTLIILLTLSTRESIYTFAWMYSFQERIRLDKRLCTKLKKMTSPHGGSGL